MACSMIEIEEKPNDVSHKIGLPVETLKYIVIIIAGKVFPISRLNNDRLIYIILHYIILYIYIIFI